MFLYFQLAGGGVGLAHGGLVLHFLFKHLTVELIGVEGGHLLVLLDVAPLGRDGDELVLIAFHLATHGDGVGTLQLAALADGNRQIGVDHGRRDLGRRATTGEEPGIEQPHQGNGSNANDDSGKLPAQPACQSFGALRQFACEHDDVRACCRWRGAGLREVLARRADGRTHRLASLVR